jgi:hypothetical protein
MCESLDALARGEHGLDTEYHTTHTSFIGDRLSPGAGARQLLPLVLALAFAPAAAARTPNACALLTNAEVAKAFGEKIETRTAASAGVCTWAGLPIGTFTTAHPQLTLFVGTVTKARFEHDQEHETVLPGQVPSAPPRRVSGVGQLAFVSQNDDTLSVWDHGVQLTLLDAGLVSPLQAMKRLATLAVTRL